jgi:hypothetical protein
MEMSDQLHAPTALLPGEETGTKRISGWVYPRASPGVVLKRNEIGKLYSLQYNEIPSSGHITGVDVSRATETTGKKGKGVPLHAMKAHGGGGDTAPAHS